VACLHVHGHLVCLLLMGSVMVEIGATCEEERGYGPVDGLDGSADDNPSHALFFFPFLFNLVFVE
jgi:hypothetical protein